MSQSPVTSCDAVKSPVSKVDATRFSIGPVAAALGARRNSVGAKPERPPNVTISLQEYRTLQRLGTASEKEHDTLSRAIRWLDAIDTLATCSDTKSTKFSLDELKIATASRHSMALAGFGDDKIKAVMTGVFCEQSECNLEKAFDALDEVDSGELTHHQLLEALPMLGEWVKIDGADNLMTFSDVYGTDTIDYSEFCELVQVLNPKHVSTDIGVALSELANSVDETFSSGSSSTYNAIASVWNDGISSWSAQESPAIERLKATGLDEQNAIALHEAMCSDESDGKLKNAFSKIDRNRTGCLDKAEFRKILSMLEEVPEEKIDEFFEVVDEDNSGQLEFNDFETLMNAISNYHYERSWGIHATLGKLSTGWFH